MSLLRISAAAALVALAGTVYAVPVTFIDFEPPTYTAPQTINAGEDGWVRFGGANGVVMPDPFPPGSGYAPPTYPILEGTQTFVHHTNGAYGHGWGSATSAIANAFTLSFLLRTEVDGSSGSYEMYLSDNYAAGTTPGGIVLNHATDTVDFFGTTGTTSNALSFAHVTTYKFEFEVDMAADTFAVYMTDLTNSGPRLHAGTGVFHGVTPLNPLTVQAQGGIVAARSSGSSAFIDAFAITPVPEPAAMSLLAGVGLLAARRRRA